MPTSLRPSTTGKPWKPCDSINSSTRASGAPGSTVMGSITMPLSCFFTRATSAACSAGVKFLWMTPMPPSCAMAMAMREPVTVSMADDNSGMGSRRLRVSCVDRST